MAFSSSSSLSTFKYDVFVSFRGEDACRGFTSHLLEALRYRKIHAFFDDGMLQKGEPISPSIFNAIQNSNVAIVVLSENYASSRSCLEELSYILDNVQGGNRHRLIIPIFYNVDPSDVRHLKGTYGEAFATHEEYFKDNNQKVGEWRNALNQIANLSGFHFRGGVDNDSKFTESIVSQVFFHIMFTVLVGLQSPLQEVCSLLELDSGAEVHMVGIYGAAGIGKTTLAQLVFGAISNQFEASYFLPDMRENSNSNIHGLTHLQNMLLSEMVGTNNIHIQNAQDGSFLLQKTLQDKKVLLVIDGVNKLEQLEALVGVIDWFASGSRVIITTRDRNLLVFHGIVRTYEVQPLNRQDALKLLSQQIFKEGNADPSAAEILNELVTYTSGIPLALKVIGSYLLGKSVDEWTHALPQFKRVPPEDIQRKLKSSFDALREDEKRVFLNIACCFNGYELRKAMDKLSAHHGPNMERHIKVLIDRYLVRIDSDDMVRLHPLVEEMGKEIVRQESLDEPGKGSRLWYPKDLVQVLQHNKASQTVPKVSQTSSTVDEVLSQSSQEGSSSSMGVLVSQTSQSDPGVLSQSSQEVSPTSWSDFVVSQSVLGILSQRSQQVSPTSEGVLVSRTSQRVPRVLSRSSQEVSPTSGSTSVSSQTSGSVPEVSRSSQEVSQRSPHVGIHMGFETFWSVPKEFDWETWIWRVVGTLSGVVGPLFFALSPPSKCVSEEWKKVLFIACSFWSLFICVFLHCAKPNLFPKKHRRYTGYVVFLIIATYSFFYDKAIDNKPSIYSVVSNAAFALVSLSKSKLDDLGFETGTFCYFLTCLTIQLMGLKSKFYLFGILLTCPLFLWHFPSKQKDETLPDSIPKNITRPKSEIELQNSGKKAE